MKTLFPFIILFTYISGSIAIADHDIIKKSSSDTQSCHSLQTDDISVSLNIEFPNNTAISTDDHDSKIERIIDIITLFPEVYIVIEGHTDDTGTIAYNQLLSTKRAKAIALKLTEKYNIEKGRVIPIGYGESRPIADNSTSEGRSRNRRVVATISETKIKHLHRETSH